MPIYFELTSVCRSVNIKVEDDRIIEHISKKLKVYRNNGLNNEFVAKDKTK